MGDVTAFRERFNAYKNGKSVSEIYDAGLPRYAGGTPSSDYISDDTIDFIILHEGFKPDTIGKDPVTGADYVGSGIELDKYLNLVRKTGKWSAEDNRKAVREITQTYTPHLKRTFGKVWSTLTPELKTVLYDVAYNIGVGKLNSTNSPGFVNAVLSGNTEEAKRQMNWGNHLAKGLRNRNKDRLAIFGTLATQPKLLAQEPSPYIAKPVSTVVRPIIPAEQTVPAYNPTINPYISGKPMVKLRPRVQLPNLIELMEDSEWEPGFPGLKNGKLPRCGDGKVNWPRWDDALITSYTIPFIEDKAVKLTDAGRATGAVLSTNLLDSIANNAIQAGVPVRTAIGLATKESTLGNPTDDKSAWNLSSKIRKLFNGVYPGTAQHINNGTNLVDGIKLINYHKGDINHEMFNGAQGKSIIQEGLEFYKAHPDKYNPGLKGYQKSVDARGGEVMNSPEVKKWYKEWEAKLVKVMRPKPYKIETNIYNTAAPKFDSWKDGKLPKYEDGTPTKVGEYNVYPSAVGASLLNVTVPEVIVTGTDRRPMYQRYDAENSTYDPEAIRTFTDFAPIVSDIGDGLDAYNAFKNRDWSLFGIIAGAALLPNVIEKALQPVLRFVLPIAKRYVSPLVDKYISPTMDRLFSNTKQLSLPSSETSLRVTADDFNFDFSPSLEDGRATAVRNATELSILDAFDSRLPYAKNTNSPLVRAVPATMENNKKLVDHYLLLIKEAYPGVSDEEAKKLFEQIHEASVDDVLYARGMTVRDPVTHEVKFVSYNNQGNKTRSAATKTHEENHTMYDLSPDRFLHPTVTALDSPLGIKKNYLNEEAGYSLPKNINDPNDYDGIEEYLSADEVSSFMSEAKSLLGKTGDEKLTEGDIEWFIKNHNLIGNKLLLHGVYKSIAEHITNAKKFALWCNNYSNVVAALAIGGAASTAAALLEYANGKFPGYKNGKIYIKPANRGKFTALKKRTGHSASWFKENGTPAQKKMAVFALNAKKWKH